VAGVSAIPSGYCECGCGGTTNIVKMTNAKRGDVKGQPRRFIDGHQWRARKREPRPETCAVENCERKRMKRGRLCSAHMTRKRKWGDVRADIPIKDKGTRPRIGHPLYATWGGIKRRTTDPSVRSWKHYGGRGIRMAPEWQHDALPFLQWVDANLGPRPSSSHTLDRIDNDGHYEPGNLRWATWREQWDNSTRGKKFAAEGHL
jgi:hypothetical protein